MKHFTYILYCWGSTILFIGLLFWIAQIPNFEFGEGTTNELGKTLYRFLLYSFLFLLLYRSLIGTLKYTVDRLAFWRSKREASEDAEFVLVVETLVVVVVLLASIVIAGIDEYLQIGIAGRDASAQDVIVSTMAALLTALIVYTAPVIGEFEVTVLEKIKKVFVKSNS